MSTFPRDPARKTFAEFLARPPDDHGQAFEVPDDFHRRLYACADQINTLTALQRWARERWPTWYTCRGGENHDGPTGKQNMACLWAGYLEWAEAE